MSEIITYRLDEIADVIDCEHKTAPKVDSSDYYSIRTPDIKNGRLLYEQANRVSAETYELWTKRGIPEAGDIILAREAPVGEVGWIDKDHKICLGQRTVLIKIHSIEIDKKYLLYSFVSPKFKDYLNELSGGSVVAHLNMKDIRALEFSFPPLPEQKAIASVLSSLDDKIDLLHRQNKTLEAMAETLFRQWFIEEAKEDWEDGVLGDIASNVRVNATTESIKPDDIYIGLEHIERRHIALSQYGFGSDVSSNKSRFKKHDILFGKLRPYFHKVCITPFDGICSTDILVLRAKETVWTAFTLFAFFQDSVVEYANLASGGTRMPRADWGSLSQYPIAIPPVDLLHQFNDLVLPSIEKIHTNLVQIQTLENLRDTLLPKLISGEVRVQYQTEEVA
ncbi:MAG: hypothetical protein GX664_05485 [Bacteroidales bacterium]|nr:hypothetical protein [Bacteroidales bacterium]